MADERFLDADTCFSAFDKDGDNLLSHDEFASLCQSLFRDKHGQPYDVDADKLQKMFATFDANTDQHIDRTEFQRCWDLWISVILRPISAFIVVDVQNDFISGSLDISQCAAQQNGADVIAPINKILATVPFNTVFYSLDWHPANHCAFVDNVHLRALHASSAISDAAHAQLNDTVVFAGEPPIEQRLWPRHCVQDTWGAELHPDLLVLPAAVHIRKGTNPEMDSYSAFADNNGKAATPLGEELRKRGVTDVFVCGVAYDVCVTATARDALAAGYRTVMVNDCCRGVDVEDIERAKQGVVAAGGVIVDSPAVLAMVEGRDRRAELGYKLAMELSG